MQEGLNLVCLDQESRIADSVCAPDPVVDLGYRSGRGLLIGSYVRLARILGLSPTAPRGRGARPAPARVMGQARDCSVRPEESTNPSEAPMSRAAALKVPAARCSRGLLLHAG